MLGYTLPDKAKGKEIRPDVSVGKLFPAWLEKEHPGHDAKYKTYMHKFPNGYEFEARQYKNDTLPYFIEYVEVWVSSHAEDYLKERCSEALPFLPKLLKKRQ